MPAKYNCLADILAIEDDEELLNFRCESSGVLLWQLIRNHYIRLIIFDSVFGERSRQARSVRSFFSAATYTARAAYHNIGFGLAQRDICMMATGLGLRKEDGRWFNRLSDHFALASPNRTMAVEEQFGWRWPFPRHFNSVRFRVPMLVHEEIAGRCLVDAKHRKAATEVVELVSRRARIHLGWHISESAREWAIEELARRYAAAPVGMKLYKQLFSKSSAKLLIIENGCYSRSAIPILAARDLGMQTAEYQHGIVSTGHDAYNFAQTVLSSSDFCRGLPQHFLSYGLWWNNKFNAPCKRFVVGNPERNLDQHVVSNVGRHDILVLGDGLDTSASLEFALALLPHASQRRLRVKFRPHPFERAELKARSTSIPSGVIVDEEPNIAISIAQAHAVVAEQSTALFDAIGSVEHIFVWATPKSVLGLPDHPFIAVSDPDDLARNLDGGANRIAGPATEEIYALGWRSNYLNFLSSVGIDA